MENILDSFAHCMSFENGLTYDQARGIITWMENEGALDYDTLRETYAEPEVNEVPVKLHIV